MSSLLLSRAGKIVIEGFALKKKLWIFYLTLLLLSQTSINAQWVEQYSGVTTSLWDICFVDSLTGWAAGISSTVLHTIDGGNTWNKQKLPRDDLELNEIFMLDQNNGFLIGNIGRYSAFLSTTNGGDDWEIKFEDDSLN